MVVLFSIVSGPTDVLKCIDDQREDAFQISSDGWEAYESTIEAGQSDRCDSARIVKVTDPGRIESVPGNPDLSQTETAYVERFNGTLRSGASATRARRMYSRSGASSGDHALQHCRIRQTLQVTPAMEAGITTSPWSVSDLPGK